MKKIILILALIIVIGCDKEEDQPCVSNCGLILSDGIDSNPECYWVRIKNDCTGNVKKFCLEQGDWFNAHPGNDYCITNSGTW